MIFIYGSYDGPKAIGISFVLVANALMIKNAITKTPTIFIVSFFTVPGSPKSLRISAAQSPPAHF